MATILIWEDDNIVQEQDENRNVLVDYTHEPGSRGKLLSERRDGVSKFYHFDADGNTLSLTDENGNVTDDFAYSAFGTVIAQSGTTPPPFTYHGEQGYYWDERTGNYLIRRRPFDPIQERWLSKDPLPLVALDGPNSYSYVHANPINFSDPSGLFGIKKTGGTTFIP